MTVASNTITPSDVSVVIATYCRPIVLRECLEHIRRQTDNPREVVVVDASPDGLSRAVVEEFPQVSYVRNDEGMGTLPRSRQIGLTCSTGDVIAFLDDDAFAEPGWLHELAATYSDGVGGVGGRARNGQQGEELDGVDEIGKFYPNGTLTGNFAANPGRIVEVDHLIGCNMSFRRVALSQAGGIPAWPAGVSAVREDLLLSLRVVRAGWKLLFNPRAEVRHIGAPQARGKRFDLRYQFAAIRNHLFVLVVHFGVTSPVVHRYIAFTLRSHLAACARSVASSFAHLAIVVSGAVVGTIRGMRFKDPGS